MIITRVGTYFRLHGRSTKHGAERTDALTSNFCRFLFFIYLLFIFFFNFADIKHKFTIPEILMTYTRKKVKSWRYASPSYCSPEVRHRQRRASGKTEDATIRVPAHGRPA